MCCYSNDLKMKLIFKYIKRQQFLDIKNRFTLIFLIFTTYIQLFNFDISRLRRIWINKYNQLMLSAIGFDR